ncbi:MAG: hypothetical protein R6V85_01365 [Polyangia bacterium]
MSRVRKPISLAVLVSAELLLAAASASAGGSRSTVAMLAERHHREASERTASAVRGQLSSLPVELEVCWVDRLPGEVPDQISEAERRARSSGAIAVFWCDLGRADRIYLYFAAPGGGRVLLRELSGPDGGGLSEALAVIVSSSVEAMLAGGKIGVAVPRGEPREERSSFATRRPRDGSAVSSRAEASYALDILSGSAGPTHGPSLAVGLDAGKHFACELGYRFAFPVERSARGVSLELWRHPISLSARAVLPLSFFRLSAGLALTVDTVTENVRALDDRAEVSGEGAEVYVSLMPLIRLDGRLADGVWLFALAGADICLRELSYEVATPSGSHSVIDTWRVRPSFSLGLAVALGR